MLSRGEQLNGTYTILSEIGSGGGGVVYKAYHERLKTDVVVKQIKDRVKGILDSRAEADILKRIKHTNLPRVYDFLEIDGEVYTVMDYIPGISLAKALEQQKNFSDRQVLHWAMELADALAYLHAQKPPIIHSDIKPANIMLQPDGDVCLIDFNISLAFDHDLRTSTGISGGYSPPEQYRDFRHYSMLIYRTEQQRIPDAGTEKAETADGVGDRTVAVNEAVFSPKSELTERIKDDTTTQLVQQIIGRGVDERSDIYSLGMTLYHLLTGIHPPGSFEKLRPLNEYNLSISEGFLTILQKMMELDPNRRYQNGGELLYALEHIYELDSEYKAYRRGERIRRLISAALLFAGIGLAGAGYMKMQQERRIAYNRWVENAGVFMSEATYDAAAQELEAAAALQPDRVEAYQKEALRLYMMGRYEDTITYARDIINNPPYLIGSVEDQAVLADIYYILGNSYYEKKDYANAFSTIEAAIQRNGQNGSYFRDYAMALAAGGNLPSAENALQQAVLLGIGQDGIYMVQGELKLADGRPREAADSFLETMRISSDETLKRRALLFTVEAYEQMGEEGIIEEIEFLERYRDHSEGISAFLREKLASAYARQARRCQKKDGNEARTWYQKALQETLELYNSGYVTQRIFENLAILYEENEMYDAAETILKKMTEDYPDSYRGYMRFAYLEADRQQLLDNSARDYSRMREYYTQAKELYERNAESSGEGDTEMQMLENMIQDLTQGGW